ncbi:MAG: EAL domain-containing protein, partial [Pseudomonadota bacterium]
GAVMGEVNGWERANWFANEGQEREYHYSWKRQNWFENSAAEHKAVRENVGMYDMSSFGKLRVEGPDAEALLNRVCGANMSVPAGKIVYTQFLNSTGGIEADVTVTRLTETVYLVVTPAATRLADETHLRRHAEGYQVVITDVTASEGVLAIMEAIYSLCNVMDKKCVVEGVEDELQFELTQKMGMHYFQGYHISKPLMPIDVVDFWENDLLNYTTEWQKDTA